MCQKSELFFWATITLLQESNKGLLHAASYRFFRENSHSAIFYMYVLAGGLKAYIEKNQILCR